MAFNPRAVVSLKYRNEPDGPLGPAGGSLAGNYPDPTIAPSGVVAATYGSATQVGTFTTNTEGRVTAASNVTISGVAPGGAASGDLTGSYPAPVLVNSGVTADEYEAPTLTINAKGIVTSAQERIAIVNMTNAELLGLNGTPFIVLPAPGAGKAYWIQQYMLRRTYGGVVTAGGSNLSLMYGNTTNNTLGSTSIIANTAINTTSSTIHFWVRPLHNLVISAIENQAIYARVSGAAFTGGTGQTYQWIVYYYIIDTI